MLAEHAHNVYIKSCHIVLPSILCQAKERC
jgi:hypothetical protein